MKPFCVEVRGDFACFTRPEFKAERLSYPVITPSAARAVFDAILWKPGLRWRVERIEILNPVRWISVRRNEVGAVASTRNAEMAMNAGRGRLTDYLATLATRLAAVRITCGSWERVTGPSVTRAGAGGDGARSVFLDPPYATSGDLYAESSDGIAEQVRTWCLDAPDDLRVILCGYDTEHDELLAHGWDVIEGKAGGGAGYSTNAANGRRERLWTSPACLGHLRQDSLLEGLTA